MLLGLLLRVMDRDEKLYDAHILIVVSRDFWQHWQRLTSNLNKELTAEKQSGCGPAHNLLTYRLPLMINVEAVEKPVYPCNSR